MVKHKLFISALLLTFLVGGWLFLTSGKVEAHPGHAVDLQSCSTPRYYRNHRDRCDTLRRRTPTPTPSSQTSAAATVTPLPELQPVAVMQAPYPNVYQSRRITTPQDPLLLDRLPDVEQPWANNYPQIIPESRNAKKVMWDRYRKAQNIKIGNSDRSPLIDRLYARVTGKRNTRIEDSYLISNAFQTTTEDATNWKHFTVHYNSTSANRLRLFYRVSDTGGTDDVNAPDWIPVDLNHNGRTHRLQARIDRTAKYFQYKFHIIHPSTFIDTFGVLAVPVRGVSPTPGASPTPSASPGVSPSPSPSPTGPGKITLVTKKLVPSSSTSATPPAGVNPLCFGDRETEPAAGVPLSLKQQTGGELSIEDEVTDDSGRWQGLNGEIDEFSPGTYGVRFGEFEKETHKLVALCVTPDDGLHHLKTQTSPTDKKATIIVRSLQETRVTALYGLRTKPYISMNKFAVAPEATGKKTETRKVLKIIYPGQRFEYLIRYENTGEGDATTLVIRDVIPEQFEIPDAGGSEEISVAVDSQGRKVVTKTIGELKKGEKGSLIIPVMLRPDAFNLDTVGVGGIGGDSGTILR